ncbi:hypothetical protein [Streptomyces sp. NPDC048309]
MSAPLGRKASASTMPNLRHSNTYETLSLVKKIPDLSDVRREPIL